MTVSLFPLAFAFCFRFWRRLVPFLHYATPFARFCHYSRKPEEAAPHTRVNFFVLAARHDFSVSSLHIVLLRGILLHLGRPVGSLLALLFVYLSPALYVLVSSPCTFLAPPAPPSRQPLSLPTYILSTTRFLLSCCVLSAFNGTDFRSRQLSVIISPPFRIAFSS